MNNEETIPIEGLQLVRLRESRSGEGFSLWVGSFCVGHGLGFREEAVKRAHKLEREIREKTVIVRQDSPYTVQLGDIDPGIPFTMVNYPGAYMRVFSSPGYSVQHEPNMWDREGRPFNDDGVHVPVVDMTSGHVFWMAKAKPCFIFPGSSRKNESSRR